MKSKQPKKELAGKRGGRSQPARREAQGDPYRKKVKKVATKLPDVTICPTCKANFRRGRWRWADVVTSTKSTKSTRSTKLTGVRKELCPACQRIRDKQPAGEVTLRGEFVRAHREEVLGVVRNLEAKEKASHPLNRLIEIRKGENEFVVTTTDIHLAHAIGVALFHAYRGTLHAPWAQEGDLLRVSWER